jgi:hypothetical protein
MTITANLSTWLTRGDTLKCFPTRIAQARYANAWDYGDVELVKPQLERIFARVHRLTALNWLSRPDLAAAIDALDDGPGTFAEDWTEADFTITVGDEVVSAAWLQSDAQWNELEAAETRRFIFLSAGEKIHTAREWRDRAMTLRVTRPAPLSVLVAGSVRARLLSRAMISSNTLSIAVGTDSMSRLAQTAVELRARAEALMQARLDIAAVGSTKFLTFAALRECQHLFQIDQLLLAATSPATTNLMTYLRCADMPPALP